MRVMFHALNGTGLGHQRRVELLARRVRALDPEGAIFVVTESCRSDELDAHGIPSVRVPLMRSLFHRTWEPVCRHLYTAAVEAFEPDLVVHDTHFLKEVVADLGQRAIAQALVLRYTTDVHLRNLLGSNAASAMSAILIPYDLGFFSELGAPAALRDALIEAAHFTGPIVGEPQEVPAELVSRYELDQDGPPVVLVSAGAGGKPGADDFFRDALDAARECLRSDLQVRFVFVAGPYCTLSLQSEPGIVVTREEPRLRDLLPRFDLALLFPGYNTLLEVHMARVPAVLLQGTELYCENHRRLFEWYERQGCVRVAHGRTSMMRRLRELLVDRSLRHAMAAAWPPLQVGTTRAAEQVLATAQERTRE